MSFVEVSSALENLEHARIALQHNTAVLLQGGVACGKTLLADVLAREANQRLIHVNVDDSVDGKDLIGKCMASETPGQFRWTPGPVTMAVREGAWLLMEDIDLASFDVFSALRPLVESGELHIADKNEVVRAHPNFRLIATQQLATLRLPDGSSRVALRRGSGIPYLELWGIVFVAPPSLDETLAVVQHHFPHLPEEMVRAMVVFVSTDAAAAGSLRDLLRWARRTQDIGKIAAAENNFVSSSMRESCLREAIDCFCVRISHRETRVQVAKHLAECCGVPAGVGVSFAIEHKPDVSLDGTIASVGRVRIDAVSLDAKTPPFAPTRNTLSLLERLGAAVRVGEPVLLTGETGVGKTFTVQTLASMVGQNLIALNLNQQTDLSDFIGGWKPQDAAQLIRQVYGRFVDAFRGTFDAEKNEAFLIRLAAAVEAHNWLATVRTLHTGCQQADKAMAKRTSTGGENAPKASLVNEWSQISKLVEEARTLVETHDSALHFKFEEGTLVRAWREGHWILLDEINLATTEVLERVSSVLGETAEMFLTDRGDTEPIPRHPNFRVFANMNPPTDVGKKDLPPGLKAKFTEVYVEDPFEEHDLAIVADHYIGDLLAHPPIKEIVDFFLECVKCSRTTLRDTDGETTPPHFSLRTLTRALTYVRGATATYGFRAALYDGLMMAFATPLGRKFHTVVNGMMSRIIFKGTAMTNPTRPANPPQDGKEYVGFAHLWLERGPVEPFDPTDYIITDSVTGHLTNLARAVASKRPVLLEGPTSAGKSSMVKYLAEVTGHSFVRINNHDSTEVSEYVGQYVSDEQGKLRFVDGLLVQALRKGSWVVLDELNLAPTEVLEALNRLLDDNCELFVPDTQELIKPHPQFRIFATQNPAGIYGGRQALSRAFRNRFLEITVDDLPPSEIAQILTKRFEVAPSFAEKMVEVMKQLQIRRQASHVFAGKRGFITPRDLFRWAQRGPRTYDDVAKHGMLLLGDRCRKESERQVIKDVIEATMRVQIDDEALYDPLQWPELKEQFERALSGDATAEFRMVWTKGARRLFTTAGLCLAHQEPVLLVGETGCSKTTICQVWAALLDLPLHIVNCHQHTEAADFLGALRPTPPNQRDKALFSWHDGPLVGAMKSGAFFLLDEISLAQDSVLERLNSVLEPSRSLTLAEKSSGDFIEAAPSFRFMATMNPGGDFGKRELSPALRNRFTELYVRSLTELDEVRQICDARLHPSLRDSVGDAMARALLYIAEAGAVGSASSASTLGKTNGVKDTTFHVSVRDVVAWVTFMNAVEGRCDPHAALLHGADSVLLDGSQVGSGLSEEAGRKFRERCLERISTLVSTPLSTLDEPFWDVCTGVEKPAAKPASGKQAFSFDAPTTMRNASKMQRACVLPKAVLLEGAPGVGKTTIVEALGSALGHNVVRINFSDHTDMMDLLGTFLPAGQAGDEDKDEDDDAVAAAEAPASGLAFTWCDGILLRAVKNGDWVILDELNLAGQTVLEGLNALLDHRESLFIPELCEEVKAAPGFRIFGCQNPVASGGGRKGLPKSFLNRFSRVTIDALVHADLLTIVQSLFIDFDDDLVQNLVAYVTELSGMTERREVGARGGPWEVNLRDTLRWGQLIRQYDCRSDPCAFIAPLFSQRFRSDKDRDAVFELAAKIFGPECQRSRSHVFSFGCSESTVFIDALPVATRNTAGAPVDPDAETSAVVCASQDGNGSHTDCEPLFMLPSQSGALFSTLLCAQANQFGVLVGATSSGKTSVLQLAAALTGNTLRVVPVSAGCDTMDLLGGFEQVEDAAGEFRWNDSVLVRGMLEGHWVVLDNANFASPSVLDRLNPVVEPRGTLVLNEQGLVNGEVRIITPHPNFRLFATMDPRHGEVSRAMRNRAIEVYCPPLAVDSVDTRVLIGSKLLRRQADSAKKGAAHNVTDALICHHAAVLEALHSLPAVGADAGRHADVLAAGAHSIRSMLRVVDMLPQTQAASAEEAVETLAAALRHQYHRNRSWHSALAVACAETVVPVCCVPEVFSAEGNQWALPSAGAIAAAVKAEGAAYLKAEPGSEDTLHGAALLGDVAHQIAARPSPVPAHALVDAFTIDPADVVATSCDAVVKGGTLAMVASVPGSTVWWASLVYFLSDCASRLDIPGVGYQAAAMRVISKLPHAPAEVLAVVERRDWANPASLVADAAVLRTVQLLWCFLGEDWPSRMLDAASWRGWNRSATLNNAVVDAVEQLHAVLLEPETMCPASPSSPVGVNSGSRTEWPTGIVDAASGLAIISPDFVAAAMLTRAFLQTATTTKLDGDPRNAVPLLATLALLRESTGARQVKGVAASLKRLTDELAKAIGSATFSSLSMPTALSGPWVPRPGMFVGIETEKLPWANLYAPSCDPLLAPLNIIDGASREVHVLRLVGQTAARALAARRSMPMPSDDVVALLNNGSGTVGLPVRWMQSMPADARANLMQSVTATLARFDASDVARACGGGGWCKSASFVIKALEDTMLGCAPQSVALADNLSAWFVQRHRGDARGALKGVALALAESLSTVIDRRSAPPGAPELRQIFESVSSAGEGADVVAPAALIAAGAWLAGEATPLAPVDPMFAKETHMGLLDAHGADWSALAAAARLGDAWRGSDGEPSLVSEFSSAVIKALEATRADVAENFFKRDDEGGRRFYDLFKLASDIRTSVLVPQRVQDMVDLASSEENAVDAAAPGTKGARSEGTGKPALDTARLAEHAAKLDSWAGLARQGAVELLANRGFEDFTIPLAAGLYVAGIGASLAASSLHARVSAAAAAGLSLFGAEELLAVAQFPSVHYDLITPSVRFADAKRIVPHLSYLDTCLSNARNQRSALTSTSSLASVRRVFDVYRSVFGTVQHMEEKEREAAKQAVLYKEKNIVIASDDERLVKTMQAMFPSYADDFKVAASKDEAALDAARAEAESDDAPELEEEEGNEPSRHARHLKLLFTGRSGQRIRTLVASHRAVFSALFAHVAPSTGDLMKFDGSVFRKRFDAIAETLRSECPDFPSLTDASDNRVALAFALRTHYFARDTKAARSAGDVSAVPTPEEMKAAAESGYNIYLDPDPKEVAICSAFLAAMRTEVDRLYDLYPDSAPLFRVDQLLKRLQALPALTTPIMKVLTGLEVLLRESFEWERNASSAVSLIKHIEALSALIIRWRRLELYSWPNVFAMKRNEFESSAASNWFTLYDMAARIRAGEFNGDHFGTFIHEFMWKTNVGQFPTRLALLHAFGQQLIIDAAAATTAPAKALCRQCGSLLLHLHGYFGQFEKAINEHVELETEPLKQELIDFVKIMRWQDANYYAVRASTERSHLAIARVVARYDEVLHMPIQPLIQKSETCIIEDPSMGIAAEHSTIAREKKLKDKKAAAAKLAKKKAAAAAKSKKAAASKEQKAAAAGKKGKKVRFAPKSANPIIEEEKEIITIVDPDDQPDGFFSCTAPRLAVLAMRDLATDIVSNVAGLQQDGVAQMRKTRALKHLFETLDKHGIACTKETAVGEWSDVFAREVTVRESLTELATVRGDVLDHRSDGLIVSWDQCRKHFYRMSRQLQLLRDASQQPSADLSESQVTRGVGVCETLTAHVVEQLAWCAKINGVRRAIRAVNFAMSTADGTAAANVSKLMNLATDACSATLRLIAQAKAAAASGVVPLPELALVEEHTRVATDHIAQWRTDLPVTAAHQVIAAGRISALLKALQSAIDNLRTLPAASPFAATAEADTLPLLVLAKQEAEALIADTTTRAEATMADKTHKKNPASKKWSRVLLNELEKMSTAFNMPQPVAGAAVNDDDDDAAAKKKGAEDDDGDDDDDSGPRMPERVVKTGLKELSQVLDCLDERTLLALASRPEMRLIDKESLDKADALLGTLAGRVNAVAIAVMNIHNATIDLSFVLARLFQLLCSKGFCKKDDEDDDEGGDGDGGGQGEGTGMDDGKGAKDVTDQLENEDQLMNEKDMKEQNQDDKDDGDDDDEDNAADVETDFKADKEKASEDDDDEDDEDDEQKEMGDVDQQDEKDRKKSREKDRDKDGRDDDGGEAEEIPEDDFSFGDDGSEDGSDDDDNEDGEDDTFGNKEDEIRNADKKHDSDDELDLLADDDKLQGSDLEETEDGLSDSDDNGEKGDDDAEDKSQPDDDADAESRDGAEGDEREGDDESENVDDNLSNKSDGEAPQEDPDQDPGDGKAGDDQEGVDEESESGETASQCFSDADLKDENNYDGGQADDQQGEEATADDRERTKDQKQDDTGTEEKQTGEQQQQDETGRSWKERQNEEQHAKSDTNQAQRKSKQHKAQQAAMRERKEARALDMNKAVTRDKDEGGSDDDGANKNDVSSDDDFEFDEKAQGKGLAPTDGEQKDPEVAENDLDDHEGGDSDDDGTAADKEKEEGAEKKGAQKRRKGKEDVDVDDDDEDAADQRRKGKGGKVKLQRDVKEESDADSGADDGGDDVEDAVDPNDVMAVARRKWVDCEANVQGLSQQLCEQLRLILEPTVADKLQGDYKTGKRINIKKIIPFIASQYKKDKIWLRRTKPNKRSYQIVIALDDSKSMKHNSADDVTLQAVALIAKALHQLDVGEFAVLKFGKSTEVIHGLGDNFGMETGPSIFSKLQFEQPSTNVRTFLNTTLDYMDTERVRSMSQIRSTTLQLLQLCLIITDGHLTEDRTELRKLVARAEENRQVLVLVILDLKANEAEDAAAENAANAAKKRETLPPARSKAELLRRRNQEREERMAKVQSQSITEMQTVSFVHGKVVKKSYFDEFPFAFYLIVKDLATLPEVLADAMRQWFEVLAQAA